MSQIIKLYDGTALADVETLTGDTGGAVSADAANNISILTTQNGGYTVIGDPPNNRLTITPITSSVQTMDATPTQIYALELADLRAANLIVHVVGAKADYSAAVGGDGFATFRRSGGAPVVIDQSLLPEHDSATGDPTAFFQISGNNMQVMVQGEAGITYNWVIIVNRVILSA